VLAAHVATVERVELAARGQKQGSFAVMKAPAPFQVVLEDRDRGPVTSSPFLVLRKMICSRPLARIRASSGADYEIVFRKTVAGKPRSPYGCFRERKLPPGICRTTGPRPPAEVLILALPLKRPARPKSGALASPMGAI
jgi:hypothetical protein